MVRGKNYNQRFLRCPKCGKIITLWAKNKRPKGHLKTMHCYYCGELVNMIEITEYELNERGDDTGG